MERRRQDIKDEIYDHIEQQASEFTDDEKCINCLKPLWNEEYCQNCETCQ